jgi:O-antigen/teichoic acid export membrane protein
MTEAQNRPELASATDVLEDLPGTPAEPTAPAEDELQTLGSTALKGTAWTVGAYAGAMAIRLLSNIVLSRILVPQYFGLMTLLNTTITGLTLFSDLGLTPNIIRSPRGDEPAFLNTAWTMQVMRGAGLWLCCLLLSWPFAKFYGEPSLRVMVPVIGLSLIISSFNSTSISTLSRRMAVRELSLMELSIQGAQLVFTIAWAAIDRSVWALVGGRLFSDFVRLIVSYRLIPGQRNSFRWEKDSARELFVLGRWVFVSTALTFLANQSDRMILGKLVTLQTLGMYGIAFALSDVPRQVIMSFRGYIVMPFVSKLAYLPRAEFFKLVLRYRRTVLLAAACILALVVTSGDLLMARIYDVRYHNATWIVPILALGLWHTILYNTTSPCLFAIGKPQNAAFGYFFSAVAVLTLTPLAFYKWGLVGSVWAVAFSDVPMYLVNLYGLGRERMFPAAQDFKTTLFFLGLTGALILARIAAGFPFPHAIALH